MSREHRNKLTLDALLIMPVQRIPRYELLIKVSSSSKNGSNKLFSYETERNKLIIIIHLQTYTHRN